MLAFLETVACVYVSACKNMRLEICNGGHRTPQNLTSFCYPTFVHTGIDTSVFKGHTVRGAVTTQVAKQGFSIPEILQFADWSQESTFTKFYYRPQFDPSAGRAVLASTTELMQYSFGHCIVKLRRVF